MKVGIRLSLMVVGAIAVLNMFLMPPASSPVYADDLLTPTPTATNVPTGQCGEVSCG